MPLASRPSCTSARPWVLETSTCTQCTCRSYCGQASEGRGRGRRGGDRHQVVTKSRVRGTKGGDVCSKSKRSFICRALPAPTDTGLLLAGVQDILFKEPSNALSIPTWFVHVSSVIEWVIAIKLVMKFAQVSDPVYVRLAYGMLPLHASSLCAVTYHFFYNAPELDSLVTLQAALTCFGNCTLAGAAFSIYRSTKERESSHQHCSEEEEEEKELSDDVVKTEGDDERRVSVSDGNADDWSFVSKALAWSFVLGVLVKYGSLFISLPFHPDIRAASAFVVIPEVILALNVFWQAQRISQQTSSSST